MKFMYISIKYRYIDILLKNNTISFIYNHLFCCNQTWYCVGMVSVTSVSHYVTSASRYQSRFSMYTRGLIPRNWLRQFQLTNQKANDEGAGQTTQMDRLICALVFACNKFRISSDTAKFYYCYMETRPCGYKILFLLKLNSIAHGNLNAEKYPCFKTLRCGIYHADTSKIANNCLQFIIS